MKSIRRGYLPKYEKLFKEDLEILKEASKDVTLPCFLSDYKSNFCYTPYTKDFNGARLATVVRSLLGSLL